MSASYPNGDRLKVEFREIDSIEDFERRIPPPTPPPQIMRRLQRGRPAIERLGDIPAPDLSASHRALIERSGISFPLAVVGISLKIAETEIELGPKATEIMGTTISGSWIVGGQVGLQIGEPPDDPPHAGSRT